MARPLKDGVDYFPLDVSSDRKLQLIEAKFGIIGFGIIIRLYQAIYADNGYYINWDDDIALITAAQNSAGKCQISLDDIIAEAVSDVIEHFLRTLSFTDGSEIILPYPWAEAA